MFIRLLLLISFACCSHWASAQVYRWVDENGKVHYTDKKPATEAEDVTQQVSKQNIDTSSAELRKVEQILRKENDADREYQQAREAEDAQRRAAICKAAQARLKAISGYVIFHDDEGKVIKVTEQERQQKVADVKAVIAENCG